MGFSRQKYWRGLPFPSPVECLFCARQTPGTEQYTDKDSALIAAAAKSLQSCLTPCDPIDGSPPGSPIPGILQARTLEWVAISFSNCVKVKSLSRVWTPSNPMDCSPAGSSIHGIFQQEYWSGVPLPSLSSYSIYMYMKCIGQASQEKQA